MDVHRVGLEDHRGYEPNIRRHQERCSSCAGSCGSSVLGRGSAAGLTVLGAGSTVGVLVETITYRVLSPRTFDPAKVPLVSAAVVLSALTTILGARRLRALRSNRYLGVECRP